MTLSAGARLVKVGNATIGAKKAITEAGARCTMARKVVLRGAPPVVTSALVPKTVPPA